MDQETFSFLFKRWSDDYATVQRLQQELAALRQQHETLLDQFHDLQMGKGQSAGVQPLPVPEVVEQSLNSGAQSRGCSECINLKEQLESSVQQVQHLKNESNELRLALQRHEEQAANNAQPSTSLNEQLQQLALKNASLTEQCNRLTQQREEMAHKYKDLQACAKSLCDANVKLQEEAEKAARQFQSLQPEMAKVAATAAKYEEYEASQKDIVASYEKQIHDLKQLLEAKRVENKEMGNELSTLRGTLYKARESNKSLTANVASFQSKILRKLGGPHSLSNDTTQSQHNRQPSTSTTSTLKPQSESGGVNSQEQKSGSGHQNPINVPKVNNGKGREKPQSLAIQKVSEKPSDLTPMPAQRLQAFAEIPQVFPNIADVGGKDLFEREFLKNTIGGTIQALIVRSVYDTYNKSSIGSRLSSVSNSQTPLAKAREITTYLCPGLDHNPWCPAVPGNHGYMFVGLGREKDTFLEPQNFNVFVGLLKNKGSDRRKYRYMGVYCAVRVAPLTVDEWNTLSEFVKGTYVSRTKEKSSDSRTLTQIRAAYDKGELTVPCVKLKCVDFDEVLYTNLVSANSKPAEGQLSSGKRRRADSTHGSHRKKVTLALNS